MKSAQEYKSSLVKSQNFSCDKTKILQFAKQFNLGLLSHSQVVSFLSYLLDIERTIPLYDEHCISGLARIFKFFIRAYLEEEEIINSKDSKLSELELSYYKDDITAHKIFYAGPGKNEPDLVDKNGITYEVKHGKIAHDLNIPYDVDESKCHNADKILVFTSNLDDPCGYIWTYIPKSKSNISSGYFLDKFFCAKCRTLDQIAKDLEIEPSLVNGDFKDNFQYLNYFNVTENELLHCDICES